MKRGKLFLAIVAAGLVCSCSDDTTTELDNVANNTEQGETEVPETTPAKDVENGEELDWFISKNDDYYGAVAKPLELSEEEMLMVERQNNFAFKTLATVFDGENENKVFSALSMNNVLGMLSQITEEVNHKGSRAKVADAYGITEADLATFNSTTHKVRDYIIAADPTSSVSSANALFSEIDLPCIANLSSDYNPYYELNIKSNIDNLLAQWISNTTNGILKDVKIPIKNLPIDFGKTYFANALAFKAAWRGVLIDDEDEIYTQFTNADGSASKVRMINRKMGIYRVYGGHNYTMLRTAYGNGAFDMFVVLPDKGVSLATVVKGFTQVDLNNSLRKKNIFKNVEKCQIPFFHVENSIDFQNYLPKLGLSNIYFDTYLNGIPAPSLFNILFSQTVLTVNDKGAEGASVVIGGGLCGAYPSDDEPFDFVADRPFMYFIRESSTGAILLLGTVTDLHNQIIR